MMRKKMMTLAALAMISTTAVAQDAAKNAAVDRLFVALNADQLYTILGNQALQSFAPLVGMNGDKAPQVAKIIEGEVVPELKANRPVFTRAMKAAYAKRFTTAELVQAAAFLESPTGKKISTAQREVPQEAAASLKPMQQKIDGTVVPRIIAKMKAAGLKVPPGGPVPVK
jgi:uncharacterized protein